MQMFNITCLYVIECTLHQPVYLNWLYGHKRSLLAPKRAHSHSNLSSPSSRKQGPKLPNFLLTLLNPQAHDPCQKVPLFLALINIVSRWYPEPTSPHAAMKQPPPTQLFFPHGAAGQDPSRKTHQRAVGETAVGPGSARLQITRQETL
jgi:hypothetical protein